ncbi:unnamed protein product [Clonostachys rosea f. rosea IK726]|uniref:Uncharacterized protein n=1 Tax=Clonostachys rosea f. rosea IK726 TaxID=1349383 RepID=A0ACA9TA35_BIOOC|nr:unnamed protein product [Clonostachys rosea f. rosea IK726]
MTVSPSMALPTGIVPRICRVEWTAKAGFKTPERVKIVTLQAHVLARPYTAASASMHIVVLLVHKYVHFSTLEEAAILPSYPRGHTRPSIPKDSNIDPTKHHQLHSQGRIGSKRTLTYHISTPEQARGAQRADKVRENRVI